MTDISDTKVIGVFGGTFNPVHYGHLRTAVEIKALLGLEQVRLIPCRLPPHREQPDVSAEMRFAMLQLAIAGAEGLVADRCELDRPGPSYMVDTLRALKAKQPEQTLVLIIGGDAFLGLEHWHQWRRLFDFAHVVVMMRPGFVASDLHPELQQRVIADPCHLRQSSVGYLWFQQVTQLDISATRIRQLIADGGDARFLLPDQVLVFIKQHGLYQAVS